MWRHGLGVVCVASLVGLSGCMGVNTGPETGGGPMGPVCQGHYGKSYGPSTIPGMQGPYGEKLAKSPRWPGDVPMNPYQARQQMALLGQ